MGKTQKAKTACLISVLFVSVCVSAQTTRTLEQCNADYAAWQSDNITGVLYPKLTAKQLFGRFQELTSCEDDHPGAAEREKWGSQANLYGNAMAVRAFDFLQRHKLWNQFLSEDENGER